MNDAVSILRRGFTYMKFGITGFNAFRAFRNKNTQTKLYFRGSNRVEGL